jgi:hypothetical protein
VHRCAPAERVARQRRDDGHLRRRGRTRRTIRRVAARARAGDGRRPGRAAGHPRREPVFTAPADLKFAERSPRSACRSRTRSPDETSVLCHWNVPEAHAARELGRRARLSTAP